MSTKYVLIGCLALMAGMIAVTLFFSNAVLGMIWEWRSLASDRNEAILHTYRTVAWLDARLSSPLIIVSVIAGLMLSFASSSSSFPVSSG